MSSIFFLPLKFTLPLLKALKSNSETLFFSEVHSNVKHHYFFFLPKGKAEYHQTTLGKGLVPFASFVLCLVTASMVGLRSDVTTLTRWAFGSANQPAQWEPRSWHKVVVRVPEAARTTWGKVKGRGSRLPYWSDQYFSQISGCNPLADDEMNSVSLNQYFFLKAEIK